MHSMFIVTRKHFVKYVLVLCISLMSASPSVAEPETHEVSLSDVYFDFSEGPEVSSGLFELYQSAAATLMVDEPAIIAIRITGDIYKDLDLPFGFVLEPKLVMTPIGSGTPPLLVFMDRNSRDDERSLQSAYIISPGTYNFIIEAGINGQASESVSQGQTYSLSLQLSKQHTIQELPWVAHFNKWLSSIDLQEELWIAGAIEGPKFDRYGSYLQDVDQDIARMEAERQPDFEYRRFNLEERLERLRNQKFFDDVLFIVFDTTLSRWKMSSLEDKFRNTHGVTFWDKAFQKISLFTGVPTRRIFAIVDVWCGSRSIKQIVPGFVDRYGQECISASAAQPAPDWITDHVASPATNDEIEDPIIFSKSVESFLDAEMISLGGRISYLERGETYIEAIVGGVRGWVIDGGQEWERVQISFALLGSERRTIRIFVDGMLASGIGPDPPPESKFTYSMEPEHALALSNHARSTLDKFLSERR